MKSNILSVDEKNKLKENVKKAYRESIHLDKNGVYRGHAPSLCSVVENLICYYIKEILGDNYTYYIDSTIAKECTHNGKIIRPDILIADKNSVIQFIVEVKANSGWIRKIDEKYKNKLKDDYNMFKQNDKKIITKYWQYNENKEGFAEDKVIELKANKKAKYLYVVLTSGNASTKEHIYNYKTLRDININYYILFEGWYYNLKEIENQELEKYHMLIDDFEKQFRI